MGKFDDLLAELRKQKAARAAAPHVPHVPHGKPQHDRHHAGETKGDLTLMESDKDPNVLRWKRGIKRQDEVLQPQRLNDEPAPGLRLPPGVTLTGTLPAHLQGQLMPAPAPASPPAPVQAPSVNMGGLKRTTFLAGGKAVTVPEFVEHLNKRVYGYGGKDKLKEGALRELHALEAGRRDIIAHEDGRAYERAQDNRQHYKITEDALLRGIDGLDEVGRLSAQLLEGAHGQGEHGQKLADYLAGMMHERPSMAKTDASFGVHTSAKPVKANEYYLKLSMTALGASAAGTSGFMSRTNPVRDPELVSPELLVMHEMAHALDLFHGTVRTGGRPGAHHMSTSGLERPGSTMISAFDFRYLHDAMQARWADPDDAAPGSLKIAEFPRELGRLHYPTNGVTPLDDVGSRTSAYDDADDMNAGKMIGMLGAEWVTTLSELGRVKPHVLDALDHLFPHPDGTSLRSQLDRFWGFAFCKPVPVDRELARRHAEALDRHMTSAPKTRNFDTHKRVTAFYSPNPHYGRELPARSYAGVTVAPGEIGDALAFGAPLLRSATSERSEGELQALLWRLKQRPQDFVRLSPLVDVAAPQSHLPQALTGEALRAALADAYWGRAPLPFESRDFKTLP